MPGVVQTLRPTSNAVLVGHRDPALGQVLGEQLHALDQAGAAGLHAPAACASGLVARLFAGLSASVTWRSAKPHCALLRSSSGAASSALRIRSVCAR